jgi:hypothetical protein
MNSLFHGIINYLKNEFKDLPTKLDHKDRRLELIKTLEGVGDLLYKLLIMSRFNFEISFDVIDSIDFSIQNCADSLFHLSNLLANYLNNSCLRLADVSCCIDVLTTGKYHLPACIRVFVFDIESLDPCSYQQLIF